MTAESHLGSYGADEPLGVEFKGLPPGTVTSLSELAASRWNLVRGETGTPVAVLRETALSNNLAAMQTYCESAGVSLAPHAKTTLSPQLIARQQAAGAWAFTAAVPFQVQLLWAFGVRRVLLANELVDPGALSWAVAMMHERPDRELLCYVDSLESIRAVEAAVRDHGDARPVPVLLEIGHVQGRTGVRSVPEAMKLATVVAESPFVTLAGVAGYEGTISVTRTMESIAAVDLFLEHLVALTQALQEAGLFDATIEPIVTAGGSAFFDRVVAATKPLQDLGFRIVLRSGCYLTHDHGIYQAAAAAGGLPEFEPALEVWARVVSRPEPGLALLNAGRRDVSFDAGLPRPLVGFDRSGSRVELVGATISALSDQHAFLRLPVDSALAVGDFVALGISHPCSTFDRWRLLLVTDDHHTVIAGVRTYF